MKAEPLFVVTSNPQKAKEIKAALQGYGISIRTSAFDIPEIKDLSIERVVIDKAEKAFVHLRRPVLVDDTGIFFVGYQHFPGAYSKFAFQALGFKGLFRLFKPKQRAYFCSYIAYKYSAKVPPVLFRGFCRGRMITQLRGQRKKKMPYDNIFIPDGDTLTFSQMTIVGKQQYDHRSKAVRQFARYYLKQSV